MDLREALSNPSTVTPIELRTLIARHWQAPQYFLATEVGVHPVTFSSVLHARKPLPLDLVRRVLVILAQEAEACRG